MSSGKVHISVGKQAAIRAAITFLYTGTVTLEYSSIKDILEVADYLQIDDLKQECTSYLMSVEVTVNNCVNLCLLASLYSLDIYSRVYDYIRGHLPEVMNNEDTMSLTSDSVLELLRDPTLTYVARKDFFNFIIKWIEHDRESRTKYFEAMFCELDLKKMSREFLEVDVETCQLVKDSDRCKVHLLSVKMKHMTGLLPSDGKTDVMIVAGGCGLTPMFHALFSVPYLPIMPEMQTISTISGYVIDENRWVNLAPLPIPMKSPVISFHEASCCLYAYDRNVAIPVEDKLAVVHKYDIAGKSWSSNHIKLPAPVDDIVVHDIIMLAEGSYVIASGRPYSNDASKVTQPSVYMFMINREMTQCNTVEPLCVCNYKTEVKVCVVEKRFICVMCYKCGPSSIKRNKMVRFFVKDIHRGKGSKVMECSRGAVHEPVMFAINHEVYVTKQGCYRYRKFDMHTRKWSPGKVLIIPNKEEPGSEFSYCAFKNRLFMFGGKNGRILVNKACSIDFPQKAVNELEPLPSPVTLSTVIHTRIPNELVSCHIDCPHCKFSSIRSQVSYAGVMYPSNEDDYDDDISYDDDDMYSDFWENDMIDYDDIDAYPGPDFDWF